MIAKLATALALAAFAVAPASAATITGGLISGALPEPATWAMLLAGFGMVGFAGRRKHTTAA